MPRVQAILARMDAAALRLVPLRALVASLVVANLLVVTAAAAPFVLYHGFGPQTFDDLAGGVTLPEPVPDAAPGGDPAAINDRIAPDIPLALSDSVRVTLVFSVGSRGVTDEQARRLRVHDLASRGNDGLTDVMMLVLADPETGEVALVSIPRDLWLFSRGHRVNASFNRHGTQGFVQDVANLMGLPIHHVVQVNFLAFADLVDQLGGVALRVDRPLADLNSVLYVPAPGCWRFSGADALAFVRSRHTMTKSSSGAWRIDNSASDHGRMARQRTVLAAAWESIRGPQVVTKIPDLLTAARTGLKVDQELGVQAARALAAAFSDVSAGNMEGYSVPTYGQRIGRAAAQVVDADAARPIIQRLRSWPPSAGVGAAPAPATEPLAVGAGASPGSAHVPLAAAQTLQVDPTCTLGNASALPSPHEPLAAIATSGDAPAIRDDTDPDGGAPPDPQEVPSDQPSDQPSGPEPSAPQEEPSDEESDDGGLLPLPDPFGD